MMDNKWIDILKLKEFKDYLNLNEAVQLSMTCHKFRNSLIYSIFKSFNFCSFIDNRGYYSYIIQKSKKEGDQEIPVAYYINPYKSLTEKFLESKNRFDLELKLTSINPKELLISNCNDYYYLIYNIPYKFTNLTAIIISLSQIQIELFQYLLDKLNSLENIQLTHTKFIQYTKDSIQNPIVWPISIKTLKFSYNEIGFVPDKEKAIPATRFGRCRIRMNDLRLNLQKLPNLTTFEYASFGDTINYYDLFNFLKLNLQIKQLKLDIDGFNQILFNSIKLLDKMTHFVLNAVVFDIEDQPENILPVLNTVTHLTTRSDYISKNTNNISDMFPNLTYLHIRIEDTDYEELITLISKFSNLKNLSLEINTDHIYSQELIFPNLKKLENLEFILYCDTNVKYLSWKVDTCANLKLVKFTSCRDPFDQLNCLPKLFYNWDIVYFPYKLLFYKVKQYSKN